MKKHIRVLKYDLSRTIGGVKDAEFHTKVIAFPHGEIPKPHFLDVTDSIPLPIKIRTRGFNGPLKVLVSVVGAKMPPKNPPSGRKSKVTFKNTADIPLHDLQIFISLD